jgi:hypothetical protein
MHTQQSGSAPPLRHIRWSLLLALVGTLVAGSVVLAQSGGGYDLTWHVLDGGGGRITDGPVSYDMNSSFGQPSTVDTSTGTGYMLCHGYWPCDNNPTAVKLVSFTATPTSPGIVLFWETASEHNNAGFHLYRQVGSAGPLVRLNDTLIPSRSPGGDQGASYTFSDPDVQDGIGYRYTLEDVDLNGTRTAHGPVEATAPYAVFLPLVGR